MGIGPMTSSLPKRCTATVLRRHGIHYSINRQSCHPFATEQASYREKDQAPERPLTSELVPLMRPLWNTRPSSWPKSQARGLLAEITCVSRMVMAPVLGETWPLTAMRTLASCVRTFMVPANVFPWRRVITRVAGLRELLPCQVPKMFGPVAGSGLEARGAGPTLT